MTYQERYLFIYLTENMFCRLLARPGSQNRSVAHIVTSISDPFTFSFLQRRARAHVRAVEAGPQPRRPARCRVGSACFWASSPPTSSFTNLHPDRRAVETRGSIPLLGKTKNPSALSRIYVGNWGFAPEPNPKFHLFLSHQFVADFSLRAVWCGE